MSSFLLLLFLLVFFFHSFLFFPHTIYTRCANDEKLLCWKAVRAENRSPWGLWGEAGNPPIPKNMHWERRKAVAAAARLQTRRKRQKSFEKQSEVHEIEVKEGRQSGDKRLFPSCWHCALCCCVPSHRWLGLRIDLRHVWGGGGKMTGWEGGERWEERRRRQQEVL